MRELSIIEIDEVNGAFLANIGAGIGGATIAMGSYSLYGAASGSLNFGGFAGAATMGFISGASFGNPVGVAVGAAAGGAVDEWIDS